MNKIGKQGFLVFWKKNKKIFGTKRKNLRFIKMKSEEDESVSGLHFL